MRFIVSTVGTSILTNLIDRNNSNESIWLGTLRDSANLKRDELTPETKTVIDTLANRALEKFLEDDLKTNRRISAELNGIYGIYDGILSDNSKDLHYLICSDTAQGQKTGELISDFLKEQGFEAVNIYTPPQLSTKDTEAFSNGTKELIKWLEENVPRPGTGYKVIFNLVGGFKSLQGYMNTFGAFYADEVVYIFEALTSDLIRIPRLPIRIDTRVIENHLTQFAMMAAGEIYPIEELSGIPETLLEPIENGEETSAGLSAWGELVWHRTKSNLLIEEPLPLPRLEYQTGFREDFAKEKDNKRCLKLQETLAKVAFILSEDKGATSGLSADGGLRYSRYTNVEGKIDHFRVDDNRRVSCQVGRNGLMLRHYGTHDYVNDNP